MALSHEDGPRTYRYFTGKNVGFLQIGAIIRLLLHEHEDMERRWAVHGETGFYNLHTPEDRAKIQLLDLLFERGELEEFTVEMKGLDEANPGLEIPEFAP